REAASSHVAKIMRDIELQRLQGEAASSIAELRSNNATLQSQLPIAESVFIAEKQDSSSRLRQDAILRDELAAYARMDSVWKPSCIPLQWSFII
ncbi:MAG: hypothetical protein ACKPKO_45555, partial [Candidatus Fonsibacter sp.]